MGISGPNSAPPADRKKKRAPRTPATRSPRQRLTRRGTAGFPDREVSWARRTAALISASVVAGWVFLYSSRTLVRRDARSRVRGEGGEEGECGTIGTYVIAHASFTQVNPVPPGVGGPKGPSGVPRWSRLSRVRRSPPSSSPHRRKRGPSSQPGRTPTNCNTDPWPRCIRPSWTSLSISLATRGSRPSSSSDRSSRVMRRSGSDGPPVPKLSCRGV
jgi:hypothetical protein